MGGLAPVLLTLALAGCGAVPTLAVHERHGVAADPDELAQAWSTPASQPDWLPADASRIRWVASATGGADRAPAVLLARTPSALPESCAPLTAPRGAAITAAWAPRSTPATARRCGNWAVTSVDGGYYAWTPVAGADDGTDAPG